MKKIIVMLLALVALCGCQKEEFEGFVPFTEGEKVKVIDGPFSGFTGEVEEVNAEKKNVTVTVVVFGRNTPVVLGYAQVEKSSE